MSRFNRKSQPEFRNIGRTIHAAGALGLAIVLGSAYYFVIRPLSTEVQQIQERAAALAEFVAQRPDIFARHKEASSRLKDHQTRLAELLKRIPRTPNEADFLAQLSALSNDTGVRIRQFTPGDSKDDGQYISLEISVSAEASYENLCRFLEGLSHLPRLSEVTAMSILDVDPSAETYPVTVTLKIYYAQLSSEQGAPEDVNRA